MVRPTGEETRPIAEVKPDSWINGRTEAPDTVTLTKSQFQQILEAIGQSTVVNGSESTYPCPQNQQYSPVKKRIIAENGIENSKDAHNELNNKCNGDLKVSEEACCMLKVPCPLDMVCPVSGWVSSAELSPTKLSRLEQKRLQWEKEKTEMLDWHPWGKPGAGAPTKKTQIVMPIVPRADNQLLMVQTSGALPFGGSVPSRMPSSLPSPSYKVLPSAIERSNFNTNKSFSSSNCIAQPIKPIPPVFKSSIAFGDFNDDISASEFYKRQQWLQELDYQRDEQKRYQEQFQLSEQMWPNNREDTESVYASINGTVLPGATDHAKRTYMRGQGFQLDPASLAMAEERRIKAQEYQHAIRQQMEEKQRRLEAERERQQKEEEAEERRLAAERARLQQDYEEEQLRLKQKAEMEEKKQQALLTAVQQAQVEAEMERKSRKIHKLIPSACGSREALPLSPSKKCDSMSAITTNLETNLRLNHSNSEENLHLKVRKSPRKEKPNVSPSHEVETGEKKELGIQTEYPLSDSSDKSCTYVVDRVLTPSIFRVRARGRSQAREFGTQTDIHYGKTSVEDPESTESYTSSFNSPPIGQKRLVRVQHSKPYKVMSSERPKWGANQPVKSYIRMTDRDPHFSKRKRMQELRKQHWAREMAVTQKVNGRPGNACLRARRAVSSSDCTLGYSSSEIEMRSQRHFRSNSTPRYHRPSGFRSDCAGSAETIAYFNRSPAQSQRTFLYHRDSQSSDNLPSIIGGSEPSPSKHIERYSLNSCGGGSLPPMRRKWHSQETFHFSPPHVPGVTFRYDLPVAPSLSTTRRKWSDQESFDLESVVRSKVAENGSRSSSAMSSGKSETSSNVSEDKIKSPPPQNPLVCPEVVTGRPTPRQDRILQNLSSLRQGLLKKQKELENLIRRPPPYYS